MRRRSVPIGTVGWLIGWMSMLCRFNGRSLAALQRSASPIMTGTMCDALSRIGRPAARSACWVTAAIYWCSVLSSCEAFRWRIAAHAPAATMGGKVVVKMNCSA
jgi:hypothetical protein